MAEGQQGHVTPSWLLLACLIRLGWCSAELLHGAGHALLRAMVDNDGGPHCQQSCPLGLTRPPGGPTDDHATAL